MALERTGPKVATLQSALSARLSQRGQPTLATDGVFGDRTYNALTWLFGPRWNDMSGIDEALARIRNYNGDPIMATLPGPGDVRAVQAALRLSPRDGRLGPSVWAAIEARYTGQSWPTMPFSEVRKAVQGNRPLARSSMPATVAVVDPRRALVMPEVAFDREAAAANGIKDAGVPRQPILGPGGIQRSSERPLVGPGGEAPIKVWAVPAKTKATQKQALPAGPHVLAPVEKPRETLTQQSAAAAPSSGGGGWLAHLTGRQKAALGVLGVVGVGMLWQAWRRA